MCELLAYSSNRKPIPERWVHEFAVRSALTSPDGWGIGWHDGEKARIEKSEKSIGDSDEFRKKAAKAEGTHILLHARKATMDPGNPVDSHPFAYPLLGTDWLFAHNGFVQPLLDEKYPSLFDSKIDSARLFSFLIRQVNDYLSRKTIGGIYPAIRRAVTKAVSSYPKSSMNLLLSDGKLLVAFHRHRTKALYLNRMNGSHSAVAVTTLRQLASGGKWHRMDPNRLLVVHNGQVLVYSDRIA